MNAEVPTALAFAAADCPVWVWTSSRIDSPSSRFVVAPALSCSTRFFLPPNIGPIVGPRRPRFRSSPLAEPPWGGLAPTTLTERKPRMTSFTTASQSDGRATETDLVTGAFSYSGSRIAELLMDSGRDVRTLTHHPDRDHPL